MALANADLEFKRGAIELLVLKSVSWGPMHGYAIAKWIQGTMPLANAIKTERRRHDFPRFAKNQPHDTAFKLLEKNRLAANCSVN
jgi:hypothetical protein